MASLSEIFSLLQRTPGLTEAIGIEKAMSFMRLASQLKNEILHAQKPTHDVSEPPGDLPDNVKEFLGDSNDMPMEFVDGCWQAFKEVVWGMDAEGNSCSEDAKLFEQYGFKGLLCVYLVLWPALWIRATYGSDML